MNDTLNQNLGFAHYWAQGDAVSHTVAYVLLLVSFPVQMTSWLPPSGIAAYGIGFGDAVSVIFTVAENDLRSLVASLAKNAAPKVVVLDRENTAPLAEGVLFERRLYHSQFALADQKEGMDAFLNKRPAVFKNQ